MNTMKPRYLILAGTLTFLAGLLLQAPATLLYAWIAPKADMPVQLLGITGTLAEGQVAQVRQNNQLVLADMDWTLKPWNLLLMQLRYQLHSDKAPLILDGAASQGITGTGLHQLTANGELRALAAAVGQPFVPVNGTLALDLSSLQLRDNWPVFAEGTVQLNGVAWALGREPVPLGDYQAQLRTEDDQIIAQITTISGSVEVSGEARLKADRSYDYDLKLKPKADAAPMIANLMKQLGQADVEGYYSLQKSGSAPQPEAVEETGGSAPELGNQPSNPSRQSTPSPQAKPRTPEEKEEEGLIFGP